MMFNNVDLPEPDGPMRATISPSSMVMSTAFEDLEFVGARPEGLGEVSDVEHGVLSGSFSKIELINACFQNHITEARRVPEARNGRQALACHAKHLLLH
jgi:hypothetical protein